MRWMTALAAALIGCLLAVPSAWAHTPYIVLFESGGVRIDARWEAVLDNAASAILELEPIRIEVTGAADRVGSSADNLRLSVRRAEAVKAYLVSRGVPAQLIGIKGVGEAQLRLDTEDGVSEPHNRWANVILVLKDGQRYP